MHDYRVKQLGVVRNCAVWSQLGMIICERRDRRAAAKVAGPGGVFAYRRSKVGILLSRSSARSEAAGTQELFYPQPRRRGDFY